LLSIAQAAALVYSQERKWTGTPEQHLMLVRKLSIGRGDSIQSSLRIARDAFETLDENSAGEVTLDLVADWIKSSLPARDLQKDKALQTMVNTVLSKIIDSPSKNSSGDSKQPDSSDDGDDENDKNKGNKNTSRGAHRGETPEIEVRKDLLAAKSISLPELLASFGTLFESSGEGSSYAPPSIATAFAQLRLHNKGTDVRETAEVVRQYLTSIVDHVNDQSRRKIMAASNPFATKVGRFKGGDSLMLAAGFSKLRQANSKGSGSPLVDFFVMEGSANNQDNKQNKPSSGLSAASASAPGKKSSHQQNLKKSNNKETVNQSSRSGESSASSSTFELTLLSKIEEIDCELQALDGVPSVASAIRQLREGDPTDPMGPTITLQQVYQAAEQAFQCVTAVLKNPKDSRLHRIRAANPQFQRRLGKLYGSSALMESCGFESIEGGTIFALKRLGGSSEVMNFARTSLSTASSGPLASFKFPDLDSKTEAFLYRKRADLEAAVTSISEMLDGDASGTMVDGGQDVHNRAQNDLQDSGVSGKKTNSTSLSATQKKDKTVTNPLASELDLFLKGRSGVQRAQLAMLKDAFDGFDQNKDNFIDAVDLKNYWRNTGEDSSDRRVSEFIRERDINNDGKISFEEFAVSYSSLLQPETAAWLAVEKGGKGNRGGRAKAGKPKKRLTARGESEGEMNGKELQSGEIDPEDVDDGASAISAAFGALRLCASVPQCLTAVTAITTIIGKIIDVPSAKSYWRINTSDPNFHNAVGKLYGGTALLKACGFALEENGSVLALSGHPDVHLVTVNTAASKSNTNPPAQGHARWETPPEKVMLAMKNDLQTVKQHLAGLLSPEISDVAAVSSAVARLRDSKNGEASPACMVVETAVFYMENILKSPNDLSVRIINTANLNFQRRIAAFVGGIELLVACGFREDTESGSLVFPEDGDLRYLRARKLELETGLGLLQKFARHEATVKENLRHKDDKEIAKKADRKGRSKSPSKSSSSTRKKISNSPSRVNNKPSSTVLAGSERNGSTLEAANDGNSVKKALIEAKVAMDKNVQEIKQVTERKVRDAELKAEQLAREVQTLHQKLDKTIPRRDASTIARMQQQDKSLMNKAASKFGLQSSSFKARAEKKGIAASSSTLSQRGGKSPSKLSRGKKGTSKVYATTSLSCAANPGSNTIRINAVEGFAVGHRVRIGENKKTAEEKFVVALGSLILDSPIQNGHHAGTNVVSYGPPTTEVQQKAYERASVSHFISVDVILESIVFPAAAEGERIINDRKAQRKYERRKVEKHIISAVPVFCDAKSGGGNSDGDEPPPTPLLFALPNLGKLFSIEGNKKMKCFQEGFSFVDLHSIFEIFDYVGKGYIIEDDVTTCVDTTFLPLLCNDGNTGSKSSLSELFWAIGGGAERIDWRRFTRFFRTSSAVSSCARAVSDVDSVHVSKFHDQLWARSFARDDILTLTRAFDLYDNDAKGKVSMAAAVSAIQEICMDSNINLAEELILETATKFANQTSTLSVEQFARTFAELEKNSSVSLIWKRQTILEFKQLFSELMVDKPKVGQPAEISGSCYVSELIAKLEQSASYKKNSQFLEGGNKAGSNLEMRLGLLAGKSCISVQLLENCVYPNKNLSVCFPRPPSCTPLLPISSSPSFSSVSDLIAHEISVDNSNNSVFILFLDGTLQIWDAAASTEKSDGTTGNAEGYVERTLGPHSLTTTTRVITHEPTPDNAGQNQISSKRNEDQATHFKWRQEAHLDPILGAQVNKENAEAEKLSASFAKELLTMKPRCDIMHFDEQSRSLLFNTTAGDCCFRFHEPKSLRRTHRVRFSLPNMPYFDHALFDIGSSGPTGPGVSHRVSSESEDETAGSVQHFFYLPHSDIIVVSIVSSPTLVAFCSVTGLPLARLPGHSLPTNVVKNGVAISALISTAANGHAASGGVDGDIRVWDLGVELLPTVKRRWIPTRNAHIKDGNNVKRDTFLPSSTMQLEDRIASNNSNCEGEGDGNGADITTKMLKSFVSIRAAIKNTMHEKQSDKHWHYGRISAILDANTTNKSLSLSRHQTVQESVHKATNKVIVEVVFEDGSTLLNVPHKIIRSTSEANKRGTRGPDFERVEPVTVCVTDYETVVPLNSSIGEKVAVWMSNTRMNEYTNSLFTFVDSNASFDVPKRVFVDTLNQLLAGDATTHGLCDNSNAIARMGVEDLQALGDIFDELNTGFVDVNSFSWWVGGALQLPKTSVGWSTRVVPSCRVIQKAHQHGVSKLFYLPLSKLIASGGVNDRDIKFWDPVAHRHRLVRPDCGPVVRWRGGANEDAYQVLPDEWTESGCPYSQVASVDVVDALRDLDMVFENDDDDDDSIVENKMQQSAQDLYQKRIEKLMSSFFTPLSFSSMKLATLSSCVVTVRCDAKGTAAAKQLDLDAAQGSSSAHADSRKISSGFLYCLNNGDLLAVVAEEGFEAAFVTMEQELLTVRVPLFSNNSFENGEEARKVFENRKNVRRVAYVSLGSNNDGIPSSKLRELKAAASEIGAMVKSGPTAALLSLGVRAVVFYSNRSGESVNLHSETATGVAGGGSGGVGAATAFDAANQNNSYIGDETVQHSVSGFSPAGEMRMCPATVVSVNRFAKVAVVAPESLYNSGVPSQLKIPFSRIEGDLEIGARVHYGVAALVSFCDKTYNSADLGNNSSSGGGDNNTNANLGSSVEMLCCEFSIKSKLRKHKQTRRQIILCFAVGRTTVRVRACDFDRSSENTQLVHTSDRSFLEKWSTNLNRYRALSPRFVGSLIKSRLLEEMAIKKAMCQLQSAVIDKPSRGSGGDKGNISMEADLTAAFNTFLACPRENSDAVMFEITAALGNNDKLLWGDANRLSVSDVVEALILHMQTSPRAFHVLAPMLLSTGGAFMGGPLCESLSSLVSTTGASSEISWSMLKTFVESGCLRLGNQTLTIERVHAIASGALLLPQAPYRPSCESFSRYTVEVIPGIMFGGASTLREMVFAGVKSIDTSTIAITDDRLAYSQKGNATLPLSVDIDSFLHILSGLNPITVARSQLAELTSLLDGFEGEDPGHPVRAEGVKPSFMLQYATLLAANKVKNEINEATELVGGIGHCIRRRASDLLLEGPMLSMTSVSGKFVNDSDKKKRAATWGRKEPNEDFNSHTITKARMHAYSKIAGRCARGVAAYEGWGWGDSTDSSRKGGEDRLSEQKGAPVCVLEISPERLEEVQKSDGQPFSAHLIRTINYFSVPSSAVIGCDIAQCYENVDVDIQGRDQSANSGGGRMGARGREVQIVSESLDNHASLKSIVEAKGGIGNTPSGIRLARYIGREVLKTLSRLHDDNLLLRDLSLDSIYLPPLFQTVESSGTDSGVCGSITIGKFFHLGKLVENNRIGNDAPDLDPSVFGISHSITPPEAMKLVKNRNGSGIGLEFVDARSKLGSSSSMNRASGDCSPEENVATASWDTWCFGAMLFELVTGRSIPAYGSSLASYLSKCHGLRNSSEEKDAKDILDRFHYDWIQNIAESKNAGSILSSDSTNKADEEGDDSSGDANTKPGLQLNSSVLCAVMGLGEVEKGLSSSKIRSSSKLLSTSALLASVANGFSYRSLLPRSAILDDSQKSRQSDELLEAIRQKWIRFEIGCGDKGGSNRSDNDQCVGNDPCCSWSELVEKMSRHARSVERSLASKDSTSDKNKVPHALGVFRFLDASERGGLPPAIFTDILISGTDGMHGNGLAYPLTHAEANRLARCATVMASMGDNRSEPEPLVAFEAFAGVFSGYPNGGKFGGGKEDPSSLILDVLAVCLSCNGSERPNAKTLLSHPFFQISEIEEECALNYCKSISLGAAPVQVMVMDQVLAPMNKLMEQSAKIALNQQKIDLACSVGATDFSNNSCASETSLDVGLFCDVMNNASRFLHGSGEVGGAGGESGEEGGNRVTSSSNWSARERNYAAELMFSGRCESGGGGGGGGGRNGLLADIVVCALRFISSDFSTSTGFDVEGSARVGGSATASLGQRLMVRVSRFFEAVLLETRPIVEKVPAPPAAMKDGPTSSFVEKILESLCMLYVGEEGGLAAVYGQGAGMKIDHSREGGCNVGKISKSGYTNQWSPHGRSSESVNHWSPTTMATIEPVLILAVTESGRGNHLYPAVSDNILGSKERIEARRQSTTGDEISDGRDINLLQPFSSFVRTSGYYSEMIGLGRTLANLQSANRGSGRTGARARRSCVSYILTMIRLWGLKGGGGGGGKCRGGVLGRGGGPLTSGKGPNGWGT